jgi:hypothetical protein
MTKPFGTSSITMHLSLVVTLLATAYVMRDDGNGTRCLDGACRISILALLKPSALSITDAEMTLCKFPRAYYALSGYISSSILQ